MLLAELILRSEISKPARYVEYLKLILHRALLIGAIFVVENILQYDGTSVIV